MKRVTIDLTEAADAGLRQIREVTGLTFADVFRFGLNMFRLYVEAKQRGLDLVVADPEKKQPDRVIEFPISIAQLEEAAPAPEG